MIANTGKQKPTKNVQSTIDNGSSSMVLPPYQSKYPTVTSTTLDSRNQSNCTLKETNSITSNRTTPKCITDISSTKPHQSSSLHESDKWTKQPPHWKINSFSDRKIVEEEQRKQKERSRMWMESEQKRMDDEEEERKKNAARINSRQTSPQPSSSKTKPKWSPVKRNIICPPSSDEDETSKTSSIKMPTKSTRKKSNKSESNSTKNNATPSSIYNQSFPAISKMFGIKKNPSTTNNQKSVTPPTSITASTVTSELDTTNNQKSVTPPTSITASTVTSELEQYIPQAIKQYEKIIMPKKSRIDDLHTGGFVTAIIQNENVLKELVKELHIGMITWFKKMHNSEIIDQCLVVIPLPSGQLLVKSYLIKSILKWNVQVCTLCEDIQDLPPNGASSEIKEAFHKEVVRRLLLHKQHTNNETTVSIEDINSSMNDSLNLNPTFISKSEYVKKRSIGSMIEEEEVEHVQSKTPRMDMDKTITDQQEEDDIPSNDVDVDDYLDNTSSTKFAKNYKQKCTWCAQEFLDMDVFRRHRHKECLGFIQLFAFIILLLNLQFAKRKVTLNEVLNRGYQLLNKCIGINYQAEPKTSISYTMYYIFERHRNLQLLLAAYYQDQKQLGGGNISYIKDGLRNIDGIEDQDVKNYIKALIRAFYDGITSLLRHEKSALEAIKRRFLQHSCDFFNVVPLRRIPSKHAGISVAVQEHISKIWKMDDSKELRAYIEKNPDIVIKYIDNIGKSLSELQELSKQLSKSPGYCSNDQLTSMNKFLKFLTIDEMREYGCLINAYESTIPGVEVCSLIGLVDTAPHSWNSTTIERLARFNKAPEFRGVQWKTFKKLRDVVDFYENGGSCNSMVLADLDSHRFGQKHYTVNPCFFDFMKLLNMKCSAMPIELRDGFGNIEDLSPASNIVINSQNEEIQTLTLTENLTIVIRHSKFRFKMPLNEDEMVVPKEDTSKAWADFFNKFFGGIMVADDIILIVCPWCNFHKVIGHGKGKGTWVEMGEHCRSMHFDDKTGKLYESRCHLCACPARKVKGCGHHSKTCRKQNWYETVKKFFVHEFPTLSQGTRFEWRNGVIVMTAAINEKKKELEKRMREREEDLKYENAQGRKDYW